MNNKNLFTKPAKICVFLGSGFDRNIGMPTWSNLIDEYASFLIGNIDNNRSGGLKKIELIKASDLSLVRKYSMLNSLEQDHRSDYQKNQNKFIEMVFNTKSYDLENWSIMEETIESIRKMQNVRVITTNVSNTLKKLNLKGVEKASELVDSVSFFPVHGTIKNQKQKPVLSEIDYLQNKNAYDELQTSLAEYEQIHIFGYSLNDYKILSIIKTSSIKSIYFYFLYDDENWKKIIENNIEKIFESKINFRSVKTNWSIQKNNRIIKMLIEEINNQGIPFTDIKDFKRFMED